MRKFRTEKLDKEIRIEMEANYFVVAAILRNCKKTE